MDWYCVICGSPNAASAPSREAMPCTHCESSWRARAVINAVLIGLRLPPKPLPAQFNDWSRRGLGISDSDMVARALYSRFDYVNSYYHRFPFLDITAPTRESLEFRPEFVVCSDVIEHIPPPFEIAVAQLARIIRPGGFAVISVPTHSGTDTREFYPGLVAGDFQGKEWHWRDASGTHHYDPKPEIHGGDGRTIAFRSLGDISMPEHLMTLGFATVSTPCFREDLGVPPIADHGVFLARKADYAAAPGYLEDSP